MTECTGLPLVFSRLGTKKIVADFAGGNLTSDGGLPLLREVDRKIGLIDALNAAIDDPRCPWLIEHDQRTILAQRVFAIAAGYEPLNDHQTLRKDTLLAALTDRRLKAGQKEGDPLSSPPTLCRLENRITRGDLVRMSQALVEMFIASHPTPPKELVLDFDATDDAVHGNQEGRFFHGYYDQYCFLPLYVTCGQQLLAAYLRPANIDGAKHSRAILKLLVSRFRQAWPSVKIVVPRRQRVLPLADDALVRPPRRGLHHGAGQERGAQTAGPPFKAHGRRCAAWGWPGPNWPPPRSARSG